MKLFTDVDSVVNNYEIGVKTHLNVLLYLVMQYICTLMEDDSDFLPFDNENFYSLVKKFEEMRSMGALYYFDVEEFEELIDFYIFEPNIILVQELIDLAKSQHPGSISLTLKEAESLVYSENPAKALQIVEDIVLYADSSPEHYFSKASIYSMTDKKDKAIEVLYKLIEISEAEDLEEAKMALAKEFQELGDFERSINMYLELIKENPKNEDALIELGLSCELGGMYDYGIKLINDFIDENPYSDFAWFSLGNMYLNIDKHDEAIDAFGYAIAIKEDFMEAHFNLGSSLMKVEKFQEAIESFKESLSPEFQDPVTHNFIGHCFIVLEKNHDAIKHFQEAVDFSPEYADGWLGFAVAYSNLEQYSESLLYIEKAIKLNPKNNYYQYFLADVMFNLERFEEAERVYKKVYESDLENTGIYLDFTEVLIINNKDQEALDLLVAGITKFPEEAILYYRYAALMLQLGHAIDAESILLLALEIDPKQSNQLFKFFPEATNFENILDLIENYK